MGALPPVKALLDNVKELEVLNLKEVLTSVKVYGRISDDLYKEITDTIDIYHKFNNGRVVVIKSDVPIDGYIEII